jgi:hypothetical protein
MNGSDSHRTMADHGAGVLKGSIAGCVLLFEMQTDLFANLV